MTEWSSMPGCESKLDQEDFRRKEKAEFRDREDGDIEDDFGDCPECFYEEDENEKDS